MYNFVAAAAAAVPTDVYSFQQQEREANYITWIIYLFRLYIYNSYYILLLYNRKKKKKLFLLWWNVCHNKKTKEKKNI